MKKIRPESVEAKLMVETDTHVVLELGFQSIFFTWYRTKVRIPKTFFKTIKGEPCSTEKS